MAAAGDGDELGFGQLVGYATRDVDLNRGIGLAVNDERRHGVLRESGAHVILACDERRVDLPHRLGG
jgi:hypothetical protein